MIRTPPPRPAAALAVALLLIPAVARASAEGGGAPAPLTLGAALAGALGRYPALAAARARVAQADEAAAEARSDDGPLLSAAVNGFQYGEPMIVTPIHSLERSELPPFDETLVQASLLLDYTLYDWGGSDAEEAQADARVAAERAALDDRERQVAASVAATYAQVLARRDTLEAQRAHVEAVLAERGRVLQLLAVGKAPEVERLRAEAAVASAEAEAVRAAADLEVAERDLARLAAVEVEAARAGRLVDLADPAPPAGGRPQLEAAALASSPAVAAARAALDAAAAGESLARTGTLPKLRTGGAFQQLGDSDLAFSTEWNVSLRLSVTLWDAGATGRRVARAAAALDEARAGVAQAELDTRRALDRALANWTEATARGDALARAAARLAEVARIQRLLLEVGSGTQVDYLAAESELAATRAARAETRSAALAARVEIARATGELSLDWLILNLEASR